MRNDFQRIQRWQELRKQHRCMTDRDDCYVWCPMAKAVTKRMPDALGRGWCDRCSMLLEPQYVLDWDHPDA